MTKSSSAASLTTHRSVSEPVVQHDTAQTAEEDTGVEASTPGGGIAAGPQPLASTDRRWRLVGMIGVYRAIFRASIAVMLQYRIALLIWMLAHITEPLIHLVVWTTVAGSGRVAGYAAADFAAYYIALFIVNHATFTFIIYEYEYEIREGRLSAKLLKPLTPMHMYLADNISWKLLSTTVTLPVAALLAWHFQPALPPAGLQIALFVPALVLAFGVRWLLEYTLALAAFWTTRVAACNSVYHLVFWFLAGMVAPNALLPDWLQAVAAVLPFRWMLAFPIEVLLGRLETAAIVQGLLIQCLWLGLAYGLHRFVWAIGVRRYSAVGA